MPKTNVIITGASRGIGFETAKYLVRRENFQVYVLSRNKAKLGMLATECAGLSKTSMLVPMVFDFEEFLVNPALYTNRLLKEIKHVHILINNAGYLVNKPFGEITAEEAQQMLRVNFLGPSLLIRELSAAMGGKKSTHIVNIGSMGGFQGSTKYPGLSYYSASKAAIACLTECLSVEFRHANIAVNCLALGAVQTEMLSEAFPGYQAPVQPGEVAQFIADFALHGHKFINGKIIPVALSNP